jgi:hypothetical protein
MHEDKLKAFPLPVVGTILQKGRRHETLHVVGRYSDPTSPGYSTELLGRSAV